ncbi:16S rRNA (cytidine(1402)-2'-O)-methyltransferase [Peptostreptococcus canis]|uniref:Ribosomal RNA small subunit methyltransferase I n=1 Tax=Peptostreptococcus canis TaxID=1159213 RepID=A0ABR6TLS0_9FIRM|nr:16S rRNA (cytidine(1402)-2'-O)-methyltransferase [Peptostreptococcus canis]MBC2576367.1 16S rRNA (cytidine(1402)-2'-O)-methyltransferase [Peptostreptococcus canis]MBP1998566.1 16S rRNA (cytidine1402-2'-O)-methyltransferase [Peptostreptococcus canis]
MKNGKLYICPTPIGNLEDITYRTLKVLNNVDIIAAEDTRHTIKLLNHFNINKPLTSYHEHNKNFKGDYLLDKLKEGEDIALVSDAGMPGISDPGADIVKECIDNGFEIEVLPGASAFVVALVGSGMDTSKFVFEGFLDRDKKNKKTRLEEIKKEKRTIVIYESPHRLKDTLKTMLEILGDRKISICRELTKKHEEYFRTTLTESIDYYSENSPRGEYILIIEGDKYYEDMPENNIYEHMDEREYVISLIESGMSKKDAIKKVSRARGLKKDLVYKKVLDI